MSINRAMDHSESRVNLLNVGITIRKNCQRCANVVRRITEILPDDWKCYYDREVSRFLDVESTDLSKMHLDIVISIGGDGTVLRALQINRAPVIGINMGSLGFLSEVEIGDVESSIYSLIRGDYKIEETLKLQVRINGEELQECTNEVVVHTRRIAKIRKFEVFVGDSFYQRVNADGIIVATPIGSTSYSYSAGGPVIFPTLDAMTVSFIAPFRAGGRSLVVPKEQAIRISLLGSEQDSLVIIDGQKEYRVDVGDEITVNVSQNRAKFITFQRSFYDKVREKLLGNVVD